MKKSAILEDVYYPDPNTVKSAKCGICGSNMDIIRNEYSPTGFAEAMAKRSHVHDTFRCIHREEQWHKQAKKLIKEARDHCSKAIADIMLKEAKKILKTKKTTKNFYENM